MGLRVEHGPGWLTVSLGEVPGVMEYVRDMLDHTDELPGFILPLAPDPYVWHNVAELID